MTVTPPTEHPPEALLRAHHRVGPDGAAWVTDTGLNAIVRVDAETREIAVWPLAGANANLNTAAIDSPEVAQIRETIWSKLLTNMSMSVLCLLTGQTARAVRDDPDLAEIVPRLLDEANSVAQSCFPEVKRVARSGPAPDHKPSILQDYELGRAMEIDVLVRAPAAFARAAGLSTPMLDMMGALAIRQARDKGLY